MIVEESEQYSDSNSVSKIAVGEISGWSEGADRLQVPEQPTCHMGENV